MTRFERLLLAAILACAPGLVHSQGFKCRQADGSTSYQDHACPAESNSTAVSTDLSGVDLGLASVEGLDPSCKANVQHAVSVCVSTADNSAKRCYHATLSTHCYLQMTAGAGVHREQACVQQATPCITDAVAEVKRCVHHELQPACVEQIAAAQRR